MSEATRLLNAIEAGDPHAAAQLLPLVYEELRRLAAQRLAQEKPGQTLERDRPGSRGLPAAGRRGARPIWDHRGHFFAAAAEAMRRILVDAARRKQAIRHGGGRHRVALHDHHRITQSPDDLLALDDALTRFASEEPAKAELVKLRFFAGFSIARGCRQPWESPSQPPSAGGLSHVPGCSANSRRTQVQKFSPIHEGVRPVFPH